MKERVSITLDKKIIKSIDRIILKDEEEFYRNRSHFIEKAIKKLIKEVKKK